MSLKVAFIRKERYLYAFVLKQGNGIIGDILPFRYEGYALEHDGPVAMFDKTLRLGGMDKIKDGVMLSWRYATEEEAVKANDGFIAVIKAYNNTLPYEEPQEENDFVFSLVF